MFGNTHFAARMIEAGTRRVHAFEHLLEAGAYGGPRSAMGSRLRRLGRELDDYPAERRRLLTVRLGSGIALTLVGIACLIVAVLVTGGDPMTHPASAGAIVAGIAGLATIGHALLRLRKLDARFIRIEQTCEELMRRLEEDEQAE